jgi:hypothetical protein
VNSDRDLLASGDNFGPPSTALLALSDIDYAASIELAHPTPDIINGHHAGTQAFSGGKDDSLLKENE